VLCASCRNYGGEDGRWRMPEHGWLKGEDEPMLQKKNLALAEFLARQAP